MSGWSDKTVSAGQVREGLEALRTLEDAPHNKPQAILISATEWRAFAAFCASYGFDTNINVYWDWRLSGRPGPAW